MLGKFRYVIVLPHDLAHGRFQVGSREVAKRIGIGQSACQQDLTIKRLFRADGSAVIVVRNALLRVFQRFLQGLVRILDINVQTFSPCGSLRRMQCKQMRVVRKALRQFIDPLPGILIDRHADSLKTIVDNFIELCVRHSRHLHLNQRSLHRFMLGDQCVHGIGDAYQHHGCVHGVI